MFDMGERSYAEDVGPTTEDMLVDVLLRTQAYRGAARDGHQSCSKPAQSNTTSCVDRDRNTLPPVRMLMQFTPDRLIEYDVQGINAVS